MSDSRMPIHYGYPEFNAQKLFCETDSEGNILKTRFRDRYGCLSDRRAVVSPTHWKSIQTAASVRELEFDLPKIFTEHLLEDQDYRCKLSGVPIFLGDRSMKDEITASLDRIDSDKGYFIGNVQWLHKDVNKIKSNYTDEEFIGWAHKISEYQKSIS